MSTMTVNICEKDPLCGVRNARDIQALSEAEQKHLPIITAPAKVKNNEVFDVVVEVGKTKAHPNEPGHFIEWIELGIGDTFLFRAAFSGSMSSPKVSVPVRVSHAHGPLTARAKCNLHGVWENKKEIIVE